MNKVTILDLSLLIIGITIFIVDFYKIKTKKHPYGSKRQRFLAHPLFIFPASMISWILVGVLVYIKVRYFSNPQNLPLYRSVWSIVCLLVFLLGFSMKLYVEIDSEGILIRKKYIPWQSVTGIETISSWITKSLIIRWRSGANGGDNKRTAFIPSKIYRILNKIENDVQDSSPKQEPNYGKKWIYTIEDSNLK